MASRFGSFFSLRYLATSGWLANLETDVGTPIHAVLRRSGYCSTMRGCELIMHKTLKRSGIVMLDAFPSGPPAYGIGRTLGSSRMRPSAMPWLKTVSHTGAT